MTMWIELCIHLYGTIVYIVSSANRNVLWRTLDVYVYLYDVESFLHYEFSTETNKKKIRTRVIDSVPLGGHVLIAYY